MAQGDEIAGLFGGHDGGDAGHAQHVALLGAAGLDQLQRGRLHDDAPAGHRRAVRGRLGAHVHHVGLALGVEVGEGRWGRRHGVNGDTCGGTRAVARHHTGTSTPRLARDDALSPVAAST